MRRRVNRKRILREIILTMESALSEDLRADEAQRRVKLARRLSMKSRVRIPRKLKHFICHGCKGALIPGETATFRIRPRRETHIVVTCLRCGHIYRRPLGSG
ncbi:MAG: ribonuclease P protein component 4 [Candidatus Geothermarchaeales archaeon]